MMEQEETIRLLQECDAGVQMGITSIQEVLPYVKEGKFRQLLLACRDKHEKLQEEIQRELEAIEEESVQDLVQALHEENAINQKLICQFDRSVVSLLEDKVSQSEGTARGKQMMSLAKAYYLDDQPQKAIQTLTQARRLLQGTPLVYAVEAALKDLSLLSNEKEAME